MNKYLLLSWKEKPLDKAKFNFKPLAAMIQNHYMFIPSTVTLQNMWLERCPRQNQFNSGVAVEW